MATSSWPAQHHQQQQQQSDEAAWNAYYAANPAAYYQQYYGGGAQAAYAAPTATPAATPAVVADLPPGVAAPAPPPGDPAPPGTTNSNTNAFHAAGDGLPAATSVATAQPQSAAGDYQVNQAAWAAYYQQQQAQQYGQQWGGGGGGGYASAGGGGYPQQQQYAGAWGMAHPAPAHAAAYPSAHPSTAAPSPAAAATPSPLPPAAPPSMSLAAQASIQAAQAAAAAMSKPPSSGSGPHAGGGGSGGPGGGQAWGYPPNPNQAGFSIRPGGFGIRPPAPPPNPPPAATLAAAKAARAPSYVKVPSSHQQQQIASPSPASSAATGPAAAAPRQFPPTFQSWIERCFIKCKTIELRQLMTAHLTAKIKESERVGRMWLTDWDKEPMPNFTGTGSDTVITPSPALPGGGGGGRDLASPSGRNGGGGGGGGGGWGSRDRDGGRRARGRDDDDDDDGYDDRRGGKKRSRRSHHHRAEDYDSDGSESSGSDSGSGGGGGGGGGKGKKWWDKGGNGGKGGGGGGGPAKKWGKQQQQQPYQKKQPFLSKKKQQQQQQEEEERYYYAPATGAEATKLQGRAGRFGDGRALGGLQSWQRRGPGSGAWREDEGSDEEDEERALMAQVVVQGTSTQLEKSYYRLTAAPDPSVVRPEGVLRQALGRLVHLIREGSVNWFYSCDQFKGLRQDCTVQRLRGALAIEVYEAHGRAALEYGDLAEFNQCQTQLHAMYGDGQQLQGGGGCRAEFTAYKILYETSNSHSPGVGRALLHTLRNSLVTIASVPPTSATTTPPSDAAADGAALPSSQPTPPPLADLSKAPEVIHARAVRRAVMTADYGAFFRLYATAPHLGKALMDPMAAKVRWAALNVLVKAYKTSLPVAFLAPLLGFTPPSPSPPASASASATAATAPVAAAVVAAPGTDAEGDAAASAAAAAAAPSPQPPPLLVLPGCRSPEYPGKAAPEASLEEGEAACAEWLRAHGAVLIAEGAGGAGGGGGAVLSPAPTPTAAAAEAAAATLDKEWPVAAPAEVLVPSSSLLLDVKGSLGRLIIPEESKVAHGDENLSLGDFLSAAAKAAQAKGGGAIYL